MKPQNKLTIKCTNCGEELTRSQSEINRSKTGNFFCTMSCAAIYNNKKYPKKKITRKCKRCNNLVMNFKSSLCVRHYKESRDINTRTLGYYLEKRKDSHRASAYADIRGIARSEYKSLLKRPCASCGYDKHVELCHKKPISQFSPSATVGEINAPENVVQLCRNCHWEFDNDILIL